MKGRKIKYWIAIAITAGMMATNLYEDYRMPRPLSGILAFRDLLWFVWATAAFVAFWLYYEASDRLSAIYSSSKLSSEQELVIQRMTQANAVRQDILYTQYGRTLGIEELKLALQQQLTKEDSDRFPECIELCVFNIKGRDSIAPANLYTYILMSGLELPPHPSILLRQNTWKGKQAIYQIVPSTSGITGKAYDFLLFPPNHKLNANEPDSGSN